MTFDQLARPILLAVSEGGGGIKGMSGREVADALKASGTTAPDEEIAQCIRDLREDGFVDAHFAMGGNPLDATFMIRLATKGRQAVQGWPGPLSDGMKFEALIAVLTEKAEDEQLPEDQRSKIQQALSAFGGMSRDVGVEVTAAYLAKVTGAA